MVLAIFGGFAAILFVRYLTETNRRWEYQVRSDEEHRRWEREQALVTQAATVLVPDGGGFVFVDVAEDKKTFFVDVMNGFSDFARLKGYEVELALDTRVPGKVGIRITILGFGVTVSTANVRNDIDEFINRVRSGDDLSDLPMTVDPVDHARLKSALQTRFAHLRAQAEMRAAQEEFYRAMSRDLRGATMRAVQHSPILINVNNEGALNMRDSYSAQNSQNVAQGDNARAITSGSKVLIGATHSERTKQVDTLRQLEQAIRQAQLPDDKKEAALRHVGNAREEIEDSPAPSPDSIGKWLGRANTALATAGTAAGLLEKLHEALKAFGLP